jgi:hypothetical protein
MPTIYKVLGQSEPAATTNTNLYTVPAATTAVCSTLTAVNKAATATTVRIAIRPAGASIADQHYIVYDAALGSYDTLFLTLGITLAATDVVTVYAANGNTTFNLYGSEII